SNSWRLKETFELPNPGRMAHFAQGLRFDLANALASDLELTAHFLEGPAVSINQSESLLQHLAFAVRESFQHILDFFLQQNDRSHVAGIFSAAILDEIAEVGLFALAYRRLKRNRLLRHL